MSQVLAQEVHKRYGQQQALDGFNLKVEQGRIVGLIGPNGSGKTTALKTLMGLCHADSGNLSLLGLHPEADRAQLMEQVAYIADVGILPRWMRVADLLHFVDSAHPAFQLERARARLTQTDIRLNSRIRELSKGMTVQLHLAIVLACDVDLLLLDEPTLGLDIMYRQTFYDTLLNDFYNAENAENAERSVLITSHEVAEIEHILTDVVFMHRGRAVLTSSMDAIAARFHKLTTTADKADELSSLKPLNIRQTLHGLTATFDGASQVELEQFGSVSTPNLGDLFVAVVGAIT